MSLRAMDAVLDLVAEHPGQSIVAVSHADPIKAIVAASAGIPLDLMQRLVISPCSITALLFTPGGPIVMCVNSTGTLSELVPS
jgi:probable phosphoglycerate mutase